MGLPWEGRTATRKPTDSRPPVTAPPPAVRLNRRLEVLAGKPAGSLVVHEIYRSIQGESTFAGLPCTFVRLSACHMRCAYCDTRHAFHFGQTLALEEVVRRALEMGDRLVEVTGGEPLLQAETWTLMTQLANAGRTVLLETGGGVDTSGIDPRVRVILDVKTPGSGETAANVWSNLGRLGPADEVKFVLVDRRDFDWAVAVSRQNDLIDRVPVLMSGVPGSVEPADLASWILATGLPIRLQLQLHKLIWDAEARGV